MEQESRRVSLKNKIFYFSAFLLKMTSQEVKVKVFFRESLSTIGTLAGF